MIKHRLLLCAALVFAALLAFAARSPTSHAEQGSAPASMRAAPDAQLAADAGRPATAAPMLPAQRRDEAAPAGISRLQGLLGYIFILGLCYLLSAHRKQVRWRTIGFAVALQFAFALVVLNPVVGQFFFDKVDAGVRGLLGFANSGIEFVFQSTAPHQMTFQSAPGQLSTEIFVGRMTPALKCLAFSVLPTVIFFSSIITLLYHLGVMQLVVRAMARAMVYAMGTSGAETLSCTANIFVGQTEAPLLVRPFIANMTQSELMAVMVGGFATVAGGVLAVYVGLLQDLPGIAGHLVTASIMAVPATLGLTKLLMPETEQPVTAGTVSVNVERPDTNAIEAAARGATDGMQLVLNIAAMLVAFVALVAVVNAILGIAGVSLEQLLGWVLSPLAWLIGVRWSEAAKVGELLGKKLVLTELLAYVQLKDMIPGMSVRSAVISSYALCGFANVASIGIQLGGIGAMAPSRRGDLARLGLRAMFVGALVSCMSGAIAGILI